MYWGNVGFPRGLERWYGDRFDGHKCCIRKDRGQTQKSIF